MKKLIAFMVISMSFMAGFSQGNEKPSLYDFVVTDINGKEFPFKQLAGKKVMIVNTASKCGLTPQYKQLQNLYDEFGGNEFEIVGFPANNFLSQEPGTNEEIQKFCDSRYGVTFPMMAKISVKGEDMHSLYKWLTDKNLNGVVDSEVQWNFQKYLIDEEGKLVMVIPPKESPESERILTWLKK